MIQLYNGDCTKIMQQFPDNYIDLTVTSPPYDNLRAYKGFTFNFEAIADQLYRITKPGGVVVWVVGDATIKGSETGTSFRQALYFKSIGFNLHDTMIWFKPNPVPQFPSIKRYTNAFEYMFIFSKGKIKTFNPLMERCKTAGKIKSRRYSSTFALQSVETPRDTDTIVKCEKRMANVWGIGVGSIDRGHPAVFPERLANDHIVSWSNPGDLVLDPMVGSGTTGKMAVLNNRDFIGIEISQEYLEITKQRITEAERQLKLSI